MRKLRVGSVASTTQNPILLTTTFVVSGLASHRELFHIENTPPVVFTRCQVYTTQITPNSLLASCQRAARHDNNPENLCLFWNHHLCDTYVISGDFWVICSQEMRTMSTRLIV